MAMTRLLIVVSNPSNWPLADPDSRQLNAIKKALRGKRVLIQKKIIGPSTSPSELVKVIDKYKPDIIHFITHGNDAGEIVLVDEEKMGKPLPKAALQRVLAATPVRMVVLNACNTQLQANILQDIPDCVISMNAKIVRPAAALFAEVFYTKICDAGSVQDAYELASRTLQAENKADYIVPELFARSGINLDELYFVQPDETWLADARKPVVPPPMNAITFYLKKVHEKSNGYRPTWLPNLPLQLGDIGVIESNMFRKEATLADLGIAFQIETDKSNSALDFSSKDEFPQGNSFTFQLRGCQSSVIENLGEVNREVLRRYKANLWTANLVIVSELIQAELTTISLKGPVGNELELQAAQGITPLYRVVGIKRKAGEPLMGGRGEQVEMQTKAYPDEVEIGLIDMEIVPEAVLAASEE